MRLLNTTTLKLETHIDDRKPPSYAILSHRWINQEVSYSDVCNLDKEPWLRGEEPVPAKWSKVYETCRLAREQRYQYVWIDTCCIDQSSSSELTEAINSMFRWYQEAAVCFIYLADVDDDIAGSEWFDRGWTLQELIAPKHRIIYNKGWERLDKDVSALAACTQIPLAVLNHEQDLSTVSVGVRMSWAAGRETTKLEDEAYCLLGIFDVNMPLLYGEGRRAFERLQQAIMATTTDQTIFAWSGPESQILAPSPLHFADSASLRSLKNFDAEGSHKMLKHGLKIRVSIVTYLRKSYSNLNVGCFLEVQGDRLRYIEDPADNAHNYRWARDRQTNQHERGRIFPQYDISHCRTAFAVLDCYHAEQRLLYPALQLEISSLAKAEFTLIGHRLIYLQDFSEQGIELECIRAPPAGITERIARRLRPVGAHLMESSDEQRLNRIRMFPFSRETQDATIFGHRDASGLSEGQLPLQLVYHYRTANHFGQKVMRLTRCWPPGGWNLEEQTATVHLQNERHRFILELTAHTGTQVYILCSFQYDYPSIQRPQIWLSLCEPSDDLKDKFFRMDWTHWRNNDHIHVNRWSDGAKDDPHRIDVYLREGQIAHSRSGVWVCVLLRRTSSRSPTKVALKRVALILILVLLPVLCIFGLLAGALLLAVVILFLLVLACYKGPRRLMKRIANSKAETRDRHYFR